MGFPPPPRQIAWDHYIYFSNSCFFIFPPFLTKLGLSFRLQCFAYFESHRAEKKREIRVVWFCSIFFFFFVLGKLDDGPSSNLNTVFLQSSTCARRSTQDLVPSPVAGIFHVAKRVGTPHPPFMLYFPGVFARGAQSALKIPLQPRDKRVGEGVRDFRGGGCAAPFLQPAVKRCCPSSRSSRDAPRMLLFQFHPVTQPLKRELHSALCFPSRWHA